MVNPTPDTPADSGVRRTDEILTRLRNELRRSLAASSTPLVEEAEILADLFGELDAALSAGARLPRAWSCHADPVRLLPDTSSEKMNLGLCPHCSRPSHHSQSDGDGGYTWKCNPCDRTWRFSLSAAELDGPHYAVVFFNQAGQPAFSRVVSQFPAARQQAASAFIDGHTAVVCFRPGRGLCR